MLNRLYHRYIRFIYTIKTFHDHAARLNRSVDVEQVLNQVAAGKRGPLTPDECRKLSNLLGCPPHRRPISSASVPCIEGLCITPVSYRLTRINKPEISTYDSVFVVATQFDKAGAPCKWAIRRGSNCMNKEGEWEYETQPSSRDQSFAARNRYTTYQEAIAHASKFHTADPE